MEETINELRREIDRIDGQLVELLKERMAVSGQIARYKRGRAVPVLAPDREKILLEKVAEKAGTEWEEPVRSVYRAILSASRELQKERGCGIFGLVGEKLGHSFSPAIHRMMGGYPYELFALAPEELGSFLQAGNFDGLNVTIPYKKAVMPYCRRLTDQARRIGSVNTIVRQPDGTLLGHNTDYDGFCYLLRSAGVQVEGKKALVLGSGGASLTVQTVLRDLGAGPVVVISRGGSDNYENLSRHRDAALLVNTTPVGMYPDTDRAPVELDQFPHLEGVFDLIYNPAATRLLWEAEQRNIPHMGGLGMLAAQAKAAAELFLEHSLPDELVKKAADRVEWETKNLLLIGMPGCGKSTVGKALAKRLGRPFLDLDQAVEEKAGMPIPELFASRGEEAFRRLEHEVLAEAARGSGAVIAAGGGVVTREENRFPMAQNSTVIFLRRPLEQLPISGRPVSQRCGLEELYRTRLPLYERAAQLTVDNETVDGTVSQIIRRLEK